MADTEVRRLDTLTASTMGYAVYPGLIGSRYRSRASTRAGRPSQQPDTHRSLPRPGPAAPHPTLPGSGRSVGPDRRQARPAARCGRKA